METWLYYFTAPPALSLFGLVAALLVVSRDLRNRERPATSLAWVVAIIVVPLIAAPEDPPRDLSLITGTNPYTGAEVANLSPALAEELALDSEATGVIVLRLKRGSPADRIGLEQGDILSRLNGQKIESVAALKKLLARNYSAWRIEISRSGRLLQLIIRG